ncbi:hypothetical protein ACOME3_005962 [Neoechinorhynchus agilis]
MEMEHYFRSGYLQYEQMNTTIPQTSTLMLLTVSFTFFYNDPKYGCSALVGRNSEIELPMVQCIDRVCPAIVNTPLSECEVWDPNFNSGSRSMKVVKSMISNGNNSLSVEGCCMAPENNATSDVSSTQPFEVMVNFYNLPTRRTTAPKLDIPPMITVSNHQIGTFGIDLASIVIRVFCLASFLTKLP